MFSLLFLVNEFIHVIWLPHFYNRFRRMSNCDFFSCKKRAFYFLKMTMTIKKVRSKIKSKIKNCDRGRWEISLLTMIPQIDSPMFSWLCLVNLYLKTRKRTRVTMPSDKRISMLSIRTSLASSFNRYSIFEFSYSFKVTLFLYIITIFFVWNQ